MMISQILQEFVFVIWLGFINLFRPSPEGSGMGRSWARKSL